MVPLYEKALDFQDVENVMMIEQQEKNKHWIQPVP